MNRLPAPAELSQKLMAVNLPMLKQSAPKIVRQMFIGQLAFYGFYSLVSGPSQMKLKKYFTVTPESGMQSLATFHFCHTSVTPLLVNLGVLGTLGAYHARTSGTHSFMRLFGLGCAAASIAVAIDARSNPA